MEKDKFYIICPDNDVSVKLDEARNEWTANDLLLNRQPLSRWDPKYKEEWDAFLKEKGLWGLGENDKTLNNWTYQK